MNHGKEPTMDRDVTSTADELGLHPNIGGHDRLVVLCLLAHADAETGEVATVEELAGLSKIRPEELAAGPLAGLVDAGYAKVEVVQTLVDSPADARKRTFTGATPSVCLIQRMGYRITKEGLDALDGHLSALGTLRGLLRAYLLGKFFGEATPKEGAGVAGAEG